MFTRCGEKADKRKDATGEPRPIVAVAVLMSVLFQQAPTVSQVTAENAAFAQIGKTSNPEAKILRRSSHSAAHDTFAYGAKPLRQVS